MRHLLLPLCLFLGACMPGSPTDTASRAAISTETVLPPMKSFPMACPAAPLRANRDIARDFLDLAMQLESGRRLDVLSRFEGPVTVSVTGPAPPSLIPDLDRLLARLRAEAGIPVTRTGGAANITIQSVSRAEIRRTLPQAACFVVPNISSLSEYRGARRRNATSWSGLTTRRKLAIFVPADSSPQELRDCLHEELAQALGPLNDLYRLPDSVFNDDNVHTVLTGFDMLILRAFYAPELHSGMTRAEVAARLPALLARLNPAGEGRAPRNDSPTPPAWIDAIQTALGPGTSPADRRAAAQRALRVADAAGWRDHRRAFSHFAMARLLQRSHPDEARMHLRAADRLYRQIPGTAIHRAHVAAQLATHALAAGRADETLALIAPQFAVAERHENAALLATLLMLRAEALDRVGRPAEAQAARLDSIAWARYGYGADRALSATRQQVSALRLPDGQNG